MSSGLDVCETHIFDDTNFALWKNHMFDHFRVKNLSFGGLSLVVSLKSWTIEISPKLKEFSMNLMHMLVVFNECIEF